MTKKNKEKGKTSIAGTIAMVVATATAPVIAEADIGEAIRMPPGYASVQTIGAQYTADRLVTEDGVEVPIDLEKKIGKATIMYKSGKFFGAVTVPYSNAENTTLDAKAEGLGDVSIEAGPHFNKKYTNGSLHVMPTVTVKFPTGDHDDKQPLNPGTGKAEIEAWLRATGLYKDATFDLGAGYTHIPEGETDKIGFRVTPAVKLGKYARVGFEAVGSYALDGSVENVKAGPVLRLMTKDAEKGPHVTFSYQQDMHSHGCPEGTLTTVRVRVPVKTSDLKMPKLHQYQRRAR
ncbi:hypothetical protein ACFL96_13075 [Thermoproteota archaeon]